MDVDWVRKGTGGSLLWNLRAQYNAAAFFTSWVNLNSTRMTLPYGVSYLDDFQTSSNVLFACLDAGLHPDASATGQHFPVVFLSPRTNAQLAPKLHVLPTLVPKFIPSAVTALLLFSAACSNSLLPTFIFLFFKSTTYFNQKDEGVLSGIRQSSNLYSESRYGWPSASQPCFLVSRPLGVVRPDMSLFVVNNIFMHPLSPAGALSFVMSQSFPVAHIYTVWCIHVQSNLKFEQYIYIYGLRPW